MANMAAQGTIRERARDIVEEFGLFDDWMGKYEYLIEIGQGLPPLDPLYKTEAYRIHGCQAQVWVRPEMKNGLVFYEGDSDALITKGLVALLIRVLSGQPPQDVVETSLEFLDEIGMQDHLSATRRNGLASMVRQLKRFAQMHSNQA